MNFKVLFACLALVCAIQAAPTSEDVLDQAIEGIKETKTNLRREEEDFVKKIRGTISSLDNTFREDGAKERDRINRKIQECVDTAADLGIDVKNCVESERLVLMTEEALKDNTKCADEGLSTLTKALNVTKGLTAILDTMLDKAQKVAEDCSSSIDVKNCRTQAGYRLLGELNKFERENRTTINAAIRDVERGRIRLYACFKSVWSVYTRKTGIYLESTLTCINNNISDTGNQCCLCT